MRPSWRSPSPRDSGWGNFRPKMRPRPTPCGRTSTADRCSFCSGWRRGTPTLGCITTRANWSLGALGNSCIKRWRDRGGCCGLIALFLCSFSLFMMMENSS
uniref:(northern house mosquito) hypothetical protein n=1 Tax=Culex pipiens TaxID=7175 RepID=A0A8D8MFZ8_CULPI